MTEHPKIESKGKRRISFDWWLLAVLLLPVLYFLPEILGTNVFAGIDSSRLNMPFRYFDRQAFAEGVLPLWNPHLFAGFPNLAESESGVFYPGNFFIHLPGDFFHWYSIEVVFHFMVAALGFYTWMRLRGHAQATSAFLAATYGTTPFLIFHITAFGLFTSIVWLPWYMVIFDHGLKARHPVRTGLWLALFLGFMLVSGSVHSAFLGIFGLIVYGIGKIIVQPGKPEKVKLLLRCLVVLLPSVLAPVMAAVQLLPTAELTVLSERAAFDDIEFFELGTWLNIPRLSSLIVFPALDNPSELQDYGSSLCYMGAIPFILAFASVRVHMQEKSKVLVPLIIVGIITLLLGFGLNLPGFKYLVEVPPFSIFRYPGRMAHVALTFLLPVAAPALDSLFRMMKGEKGDVWDAWWSGFSKGMVVAGVVGILGLMFGSGLTKPGYGIALVLCILALLAVVAPKKIDGDKIKTPAFTLLIIALVLSLAVQLFLTYPFSRILVPKRGNFDESLTFFDDVKAEFPTEWEIPRVLQAGSFHLLNPDAMSNLSFTAQENIWDNMSGNAAGLRGVTSIRGLTPLNQNNWKLVIRDTLQSRIDTVIARCAVSDEPKTPDVMSMRLIRMLGADILLLEGDDWNIPGFELWRTDLDLPYHEGLCAYRVSENRGGWVPDAYFVRNAWYGEYDYAALLGWLREDGLDIENEAVIQRRHPAGFEDREFPEATNYRGILRDYNPDATILSRDRGMNWLSFDVNIEGDQLAFLVTGENHLPGWNAYVDGDRVQLYQADLLFIGIEIPPGEHTVELRYQPKSVVDGIIISISGIIVWLLFLGVVTWAHRKEDLIKAADPEPDA